MGEPVVRKTRKDGRAMVRLSYKAQSGRIVSRSVIFPILGLLKPGVSKSSGIYLPKIPTESSCLGLDPEEK